MSLNATCSSCTKVEICSPYRTTKSFEDAFVKQWTGIVKIPFPAETLALNCNHFESPEFRTKLQKLDMQDLEEIISGLTDASMERDTPINILQLAIAEYTRRNKKDHDLT